MIRLSAYRTMLFIFILSLNQLFSADDNQKVSVTLFSSNATITPLQMNVRNILHEEFKSRNLLGEDSALWNIFIVLREIEERSTIISVTLMQSLPKEVIEAGTNHQIFYAALEKEKSLNDSEKNQEIRKYVTSKFLSNYKQVLESEIMIAQNDNITKTCRQIVNNFVTKYVK